MKCSSTINHASELMEDSLSFNSSLGNKTVQPNRDKIQNEIPVFDPILMSVKVIFPIKYESIFKGVSEIPFLYEFTENTEIQIFDLLYKNKIVEIETGDFEAFADSNSRAKFCFIFGKEQFKLQNKLQTNKKYKESIKTKTFFKDELKYKSIKENYLKIQIERLVNFVFIEGPDHLHSQLKSLVSIYRDKEQYIPKTKKFDVTEKREYIKNLIQMISGVSERIGKAIVEEYKTLGELENGLLNKEQFCQLKIADGERGISEKLYNKLYKAFHSSDANQKL